MRPELVQFSTKDKLMLPGLLYAPKKRTKKAVIFLHGNGSSSVFYMQGRMQIFGEELIRQGIAFLAFHNRGAQYVHAFKVWKGRNFVRRRYGMAYERIKECVTDIDAAVKFMRSRGYGELYLLGHSTGANKIAVYDHYKPRNPIRKYVLWGGGDDVGSYYLEFGRKRFFELLRRARLEIAKRNGSKLIPADLVNQWIFSWQAFYDIADPDGDYNVFPFNEYVNGPRLSRKKPFRYFRAIRKPSLVVYGNEDPYTFTRVEKAMRVLKENCGAPERFAWRIITGADHGMHRKEREFGRTAAKWLAGK